MTTSAFAMRSTTVGHLVRIDGTAPVDWTLYLCSMGNIVADSGVQDWQPKIANFPEIPLDNRGFGRANLSLTNRGPYLISVDGVDTSYPDLLSALQALTFEGAALSVYVRARSRGTVESETLLKASISAIADVTPATTTLEFEAREALANRQVPATVIGRPEFVLSDDQRRIPDETDGDAAPYSYGSPQAYIPTLYQSFVDRDMLHRLYQYGLRPQLHKAIPVQDGPTSRRYVWTERRDLQVPTIGTAARDVFIYQGDAYAWVWDYENLYVSHDSSGGWRDHFYTFVLRNRLWATIPIMPESLDEDDCIGLTDGWNMMTPSLDSYATLAPAGKAFLTLPRISSRGRVSLNTDEAGVGSGDNFEQDAPAGVTVFMVLGGQSSVNALAAGQLYLTWPNSDQPVFGDVATITAVNPLDLQIVEVSLDAGQFRGTRFERWDFSAQTDSDPDSPDFPLYHASNGDNAGPLRICINRSGAFNSADLKILWAGIKIGYQLNRTESRVRSPFDRYRDRYPLPFWQRQIDEARKRTAVEEFRSADTPSRVWISAQSYQDDGSGTYTGTAAKVLQNPIDTIHHLLKSSEYGADAVRVAVGTHASLTEARTALNRWARWGNNNSALEWKSWGQIDQQQEIGNDLFAEITAGFPQIDVVKVEQSWGAVVWIPWQTYWNTGSLYRTLQPVEAADEFAASPEAMSLSFNSSWSEVINEFEVHYDLDPESGDHRTASVTATSSDDGYGNAWPSTPVGGVSAADIAGWSLQTYGKKRLVNPIVLRGVSDSRIAVACGLYFLWRHYKPRVRFAGSGGTSLADLTYGQILVLGNSIQTHFGMAPPFWEEATSWSDLYWRCTGVRIVDARGRIVVRVTGEEMPNSIGAEVTGAVSPQPLGSFAGEPGGRFSR